MLTNNFYTLFKGFGFSTGSTHENLFMTAYNGAKNKFYPFSLYTDYFCFNKMSPQIKSIGNSYNCCGIYFGKDNTTATPEDYCLKSHIASGLQCTLVNKTAFEYSEELDEYFNGYTKSISISCTISSGMTIGEIGWFGYIDDYIYLLDRTVFETPIVLEYQNTCVIDYTIMNKISLAKLGQ